mmetsp:Transcript_6588/g.11584  ORF Transcript_6588/g.11584 Transcript_6588/m.11584 type:complete len:636 (+) Transcript_6588:1103-3010(+)
MEADRKLPTPGRLDPSLLARFAGAADKPTLRTNLSTQFGLQKQEVSKQEVDAKVTRSQTQPEVRHPSPPEDTAARNPITGKVSSVAELASRFAKQPQTTPGPVERKPEPPKAVTETRPSPVVSKPVALKPVVQPEPPKAPVHVPQSDRPKIVTIEAKAPEHTATTTSTAHPYVPAPGATESSFEARRKLFESRASAPQEPAPLPKKPIVIKHAEVKPAVQATLQFASPPAPKADLSTRAEVHAEAPKTSTTSPQLPFASNDNKPGQVRSPKNETPSKPASHGLFGLSHEEKPKTNSPEEAKPKLGIFGVSLPPPPPPQPQPSHRPEAVLKAAGADESHSKPKASLFDEHGSKPTTESTKPTVPHASSEHSEVPPKPKGGLFGLALNPLSKPHPAEDTHKPVLVQHKANILEGTHAHQASSSTTSAESAHKAPKVGLFDQPSGAHHGPATDAAHASKPKKSLFDLEVQGEVKPKVHHEEHKPMPSLFGMPAKPALKQPHPESSSHATDEASSKHGGKKTLFDLDDESPKPKAPLPVGLPGLFTAKPPNPMSQPKQEPPKVAAPKPAPIPPPPPKAAISSSTSVKDATALLGGIFGVRPPVPAEKKPEQQERISTTIEFDKPERPPVRPKSKNLFDD